jgi:predicted glycosyltransferase
MRPAIPRARSPACSPSGPPSSCLVEAYPPDVVVVDHAPAGIGGELLPVLARLAAQRLRPRFILGLRDIVGEVAATRLAWARHGIHELLEEL